MFLLGVELAVSRVLHGFTVSPTMTPVQTKKKHNSRSVGLSPLCRTKGQNTAVHFPAWRSFWGVGSSLDRLVVDLPSGDGRNEPSTLKLVSSPLHCPAPLRPGSAWSSQPAPTRSTGSAGRRQSVVIQGQVLRYRGGPQHAQLLGGGVLLHPAFPKWTKHRKLMKGEKTQHVTSPPDESNCYSRRFLMLFVGQKRRFQVPSPQVEQKQSPTYQQCVKNITKNHLSRWCFESLIQ